jgi:hypothetical protein
LLSAATRHSAVRYIYSFFFSSLFFLGCTSKQHLLHSGKRLGITQVRWNMIMNKLITWSHIPLPFFFKPHATLDTSLNHISKMLKSFLFCYSSCSKDHDIDDGLTELRSGSSPDEGIGTELDSPKGIIIYTKHHVVITWTDFIAYRHLLALSFRSHRVFPACGIFIKIWRVA